MINLLFERLPNTLTIHNQEYRIDTNFYRWIALNEMLLDQKTTVLMLYGYLKYIFIDELPPFDEDTISCVSIFLKGYRCDYKASGKGISTNSRYVFSFTYDCDYVIGAFQECYGIDLINIDYLHWWHFLALFSSLDADCELMRRIAIRSTKLSDISDKKQRNQLRKQQRAIAIPAPEMTEENIGSVLW